jgi:hypothetical protein
MLTESTGYGVENENAAAFSQKTKASSSFPSETSNGFISIAAIF